MFEVILSTFVICVSNYYTLHLTDTLQYSYSTFVKTNRNLNFSYVLGVLAFLSRTCAYAQSPGSWDPPLSVSDRAQIKPPEASLDVTSHKERSQHHTRRRPTHGALVPDLALRTGGAEADVPARHEDV